MDAYTAFGKSDRWRFSDVKHFSSDVNLLSEQIIEVIVTANFSNFKFFGRIYGKQKERRS